MFHSVCLLYWPTGAKAALHEQLRAASRARDIYRLGLELCEGFDALHAGQGSEPAAADRPNGATFDVTLTRYGAGLSESRVVAQTTPDFTSLHWRG